MILAHDAALDLKTNPIVERRAILVSDLADELRTAPSVSRDALLSRRDALLGAELANGAGMVVGLRGTAQYVAFQDVSDALTAARSLAFDGAKVAIDFGDIEMRGGDGTGPLLVRSARLVAASHPGQIVMSEQAQEALNRSGRSGWTVTSLGRHRLRGVESPLLVFQADRGDASAFPPLQVDRFPPPVPGAHPSVSGYELRDRIAEDDYGTLYRAYQHSIGREVTVRLFREELVSDPRFVRRFEAESQRVAQLVHPHLVPVLDYWREPERAVIVMRSVSSRTLAGLLGTRPDSERAKSLLARVGAGIETAHGAGVFHGALTPSSVVLDDGDIPIVTDLGLEHITGGLVRARTGRYAAPEMIERDPSAVADVYSLAAIARDLLAGSDTDGDVESDEVLAEALGRALDPDPTKRTSSVRAFLEDLLSGGGAAGGSRRVSVTVRNPYKGLSAFSEADAGVFFGRAKLADELVRSVASSSLTLVVGPSGAGKSSVVRAGLIPALRKGAVPGSEEWMIVDMVPGSAPFEELTAALARISNRPTASTVERIRSGEISFVEACDAITGSQPVLLVVDQFEELYTVADQEDALAFVRMIRGVAERGGPSTVKVAVTLRADFYDRPLQDPEFGGLVGPHTVTVPALGFDGIVEIIRRPAVAVGVEIDDDLVLALAEDAVRQPGALPLVEHMLAELFDERTGNRLTLSQYRSAGGLTGSIGRRAENVYHELDADARRAAHDIFVRLVTVGDESAEDTRRRVRRSDLDRCGHERSSIDAVLDAFGRLRLITFDRDAATRGPTVEVAHEAILREWPRLVEWIDACRDDLLVRRRIEAASRDWNHAGRDPSYLLGGARLEQAETWLSANDLPAGEVAVDLVRESRRHEDAVQEHRSHLRRRIMASLIVGLVVVSSLGVSATFQARAARRQALENQMAELATEALVAMNEDPDLAILLALEAYDRSVQLGETPPDVMSALHRTVQGSRLERVIPDGRWAMAVSPAGDRIVTDAREDSHVLRSYDLDSGAVAERRLDEPIGGMVFAPDGSEIVVSYYDWEAQVDRPDSGPALTVIDARTLETVREVGGGGETDTLSFSGDGRFLIGSGWDGQRVWDTSAGWSEWGIARPDPSGSFVPGSSVMASATRDGTVEFLDLTTYGGDPRPESAIETGIDLGGPGVVAVHPDGDRVAIANPVGQRVEIWSRSTGDLLWFEGRFPLPIMVSFTPDGSRLVIGGDEPNVHIVDLDTHERLELPGHGPQVAQLWASDTRVAARTGDGNIKVWSIGPVGVAGDEVLDFGEGNVFMMRLGDHMTSGVVLTSDRDAAAVMIDDSSREPIETARFWYTTWFWPLLSEDGGLVAGMGADDRVGVVMDVATGDEILRLRPCEVPKGIDSTAGFVSVWAQCPQGVQIDPSLPPRTGLVDINTDEVVLDLGPREWIGLAMFGASGTPAEDLVTLVDQTNQVEVWRVSDGQLLGSWSQDGRPRMFSPFFSHDGRHLIVSHQNGDLAVFDVASIQEGTPVPDAHRYTTRAHSGVLRFLDASVGVAATSGPEVRIWDIDSGDLIADLGERFRSAVTVTDDGSAVYVGEGNGVMRRVPLSPAGLADLAMARINRSFTDEECRRFLTPAECTDG